MKSGERKVGGGKAWVRAAKEDSRKEVSERKRKERGNDLRETLTKYFVIIQYQKKKKKKKKS